MAIARMLAVKRFRKHLIRLQHSEVTRWSDKQLKNALFKNSPSWLELLKWLLGQLDEDIKGCLLNCDDDERVERIKDSILLLGLSTKEKVDKCVQGRVVFKERENLLTQLVELVRMKKFIDSGGAPTGADKQEVTLEDIITCKEYRNLERLNELRMEEGVERSEMLSGQELFDLMVSKHPEYRRLLDAAEAEAITAERSRQVAVYTGELDSVDPVSPCHCRAVQSGQGHKKDSGVNSPPPKTTMGYNIKDSFSTGGDSNDKPKNKVIPESSVKTTVFCSKGRRVRGKRYTPQMDESATAERLTSRLWADDSTGCSSESPSDLLSKVLSEPKATAAMNYLEAVHELVNDLERTCQLAK